MRDIKQGVHQSHCCQIHGCKYGYESECPVENKTILQDHLCEDCSGDLKEAEQIVDQINKLRQITALKTNETSPYGQNLINEAREALKKIKE